MEETDIERLEDEINKIKSHLNLYDDNVGSVKDRRIVFSHGPIKQDTKTNFGDYYIQDGSIYEAGTSVAHPDEFEDLKNAITQAENLNAKNNNYGND